MSSTCSLIFTPKHSMLFPDPTSNYFHLPHNFILNVMVTKLTFILNLAVLPSPVCLPVDVNDHPAALPVISYTKAVSMTFTFH